MTALFVILGAIALVLFALALYFPWQAPTAVLGLLFLIVLAVNFVGVGALNSYLVNSGDGEASALWPLFAVLASLPVLLVYAPVVGLGVLLRRGRLRRLAKARQQAAQPLAT